MSKTRKYRSTKKLESTSATDSCLNNAKRPSLVNCISTSPECRSDHRWLVCIHSPGPDTTSIWFLCHRAFMKSFASSRQVRRQSVFTKFRVASCQWFAPCPCFASCHCCHDPFIVRSTQTRQPFTGFHSTCTSVSTFANQRVTTVCFCARVSVITSGLQSRHQIPRRLVTFIL